MDVLSKIVSNGFFLILPMLVWNIVFTSKLPSVFRHNLPNIGKVKFLTTGEQIFRYIIFLAPLLMRTSLSTPTGKAGLLCYIAGTALYFSSWLPQLVRPSSRWSTSMTGVLAPAFTPVIWLLGISLMTNSYYFSFVYSPWHYLVPSIVFSVLHVSLMYKTRKDWART